MRKYALIGALVGAIPILLALLKAPMPGFLIPAGSLMMDIDPNFTPHFYNRMLFIASVVNILFFAIVGMGVKGLVNLIKRTGKKNA